MNSIKNIAILGGGPAASTLAILLCRKDCKVVMFAPSTSSPLLVGESLVPMIIPMLQDLGIEQQIAAESIYKSGACFTYNAREVFEFPFADNPSDIPTYAYNVCREQFNKTLLDTAKQAGAKVIEHKVLLSKVDEEQITLDANSLQQAAGLWDKNAPDFIVDASGRVNLIGQLLDIPMHKGARQDLALFAHVDQTQLVHSDYVHNDRIEQGWCWRIPLPNRVSLGFVIPENYALQWGDSATQQYDNLLREDKVLQQLAGNAKRLTPVLRFNNYQAFSDQLVAENWAMLGDSAGFVDPIFSSGLLIAMDSAYQLADTLLNNKPLTEYEERIKHHLQAWIEIVSYYYNGRLMSSIKVGQTLKNNYLNRLLFRWISGQLSRVFSGEAGTRQLSLSLLRFLVKYGLKDQDPRVYKIK